VKIIGTIIVATAAACGGTARGAEKYLADTQRLLEGRNGQLKSCYDEALKSDARLAGSITVHFRVEKKTGTVTGVAVGEGDRRLLSCVKNALGGLQLAPGDKHEGRATFTFDFEPGGQRTSSVVVRRTIALVARRPL
jgi:hypothetical protein